MTYAIADGRDCLCVFRCKYFLSKQHNPGANFDTEFYLTDDPDASAIKDLPVYVPDPVASEENPSETDSVPNNSI